MALQTQQPLTPVEPDMVENNPNPLGDFSDFAERMTFPKVWWLTELELHAPRQNLHCLSESTKLAKRTLDIVVSLGLLIGLSPVMLIVAILVKLTSRGETIFSQTRVGLNERKINADRRQADNGPNSNAERRQPGRDRRTEFAYGRHFTLYKFRTMKQNAENGKAQFAVKGDPRITPIGLFLRKTRLDELPQLINVLRGEMSLVGPRPERPEFMEKLSAEIPSYLDRLGLKPGLTGVAQILNGYDNEIESFRRKAAYDLHYLQNCTAWNDMKILIRTIRVVLTGSGAL